MILWDRVCNSAGVSGSLVLWGRVCANAGVSGTIKPFHDLILAWQPSLASRPSCLCKSPYRPAASKYEKCFTSPSGQAASCFADYFGNACPARREEAVCLLWDYVTPCPKLPRDLCPTQNHLLPPSIFIPFFQGRQVYFRASNIYKTRSF